jgi:hypothetical protein
MIVKEEILNHQFVKMEPVAEKVDIEVKEISNEMNNKNPFNEEISKE